MQEIEYYFTCPYCGAPISFLLDLTFHQQQYIEDCEVCCNPIEISFVVKDSTIHYWKALRTDN